MGIRIGRNSHKSAVIAYADDLTLLLMSPSEIPKLQTILDQYGKACGAKINIQKSKAMAMGMWDTRLNIMGIQYYENPRHPLYEHDQSIGTEELVCGDIWVTGASTRNLLQRAKSQQTKPLCPNLHVSPRVVHRTDISVATDL